MPFSVFALLAFLCVPALAVAGDASDIEYKDAPPPKPGQTAGSSGAGGIDVDGRPSGGSGSKGSSRGSGADGGSFSDDDKSGGAAAGKGDGGNGQGSQGGGAANEAGVGYGYPIDDGAAISGDGGSSPLAPILIALAVLATISIGVVAVRRRRQDGHRGGSRSGRVSPEAG